ncbi:MFS transporter [Kitasatospora sp. NPDC058190]|uniref:MFS transporter n=1 Tax=Kitasatospora sp. NPDC058190 TaxID=3346371 RepID=UPI0036DF7789
MICGSTPPTAGRRLRMTLFASNTFVSTLGSGLFLAVSPSYFHTALGIPAERIGLGLGAGALVGLVVGFWLGRIADRFGAATTMCAINAWRVLGYLGLVWVRDFWSFLLVSVLLLAVDRPAMPVNQAAVGEVFDGPGRTQVMAVVRALRNIGFLVGVGLAALLLGSGSPAQLRGAVVVNALSYLPGVFFFWWVGRRTSTGPAAALAGIGTREILRRPGGRPAALFSGCNLVLMSHDTVLLTVLPLWVLDHTSAPSWTQPVLLGVNSVFAIALQVPVSRRLRDGARAASSLGLAGGLFAAAAVCYAAAGAFADPSAALSLLVAGTCLVSVVEVVHLCAFTELTFTLSPAEAPASYLGFYHLGVNAQHAAGPAVLTWLTAGLLAPGWLVLGALYAAAAVVGGHAAKRTALTLNGVQT